mmetsp:Transcript_12019/g.34359  ORF Transcript_12019/g.34359 Transcript_12019/m.34359 type:complete len:215 (+) Transcript_12019:125-769(+)|eukprot:CAMPEP_0181027418 /NCGR_PEP_ID=MMETSP1070-20121207/4154_1 /TAXON_ID=265543 /ORGANISM="Minutocellus polymorphus, Strain NH13" /LENGTH=214 /DNA_ID=CAMNT_0023104659 /DNA_START=277 /DNA_END=921 /DNA_ORIENTATION=-
MAYAEVAAGYEDCPSWAPFLGFFGAAMCGILANFGAAWGTWKSGLGLCKMGVNHPGGMIKNLVAIIMAGVLGIYGLIVAIIIAGRITEPDNAAGYNTYSQFNGWAHVGAGLTCGLSCLAAGGTIGMIGETGVIATGLRAEGNMARMFRSMPSGKGDGGDEDGGAAGVPDTSVVMGDENKLFVGMLIMLIFSEALALYGLIVALIVSQASYSCGE